MNKSFSPRQVLDDVHHLLADLKSCSARRDLRWGRRIHAKAFECRNESHMYVASALIKMYAKCGSMIDAQRMFENIQKPDLISWTALLLGYVDSGEGHVALELFSTMSERGCVPDSITYIAALKACTSLALNGNGKGDCLLRGREIHSKIGCHLNEYVKSTLIDMYAKCGSMTDARKVFETIEKPDVVCWNALLLGYVESGEGQVALELFYKMKAHGWLPDSVTYIASLKACSSLRKPESGERLLGVGREIHSMIGGHLNHTVQNTLIDMYAKCGSMVDARGVYDSISKPNVVSHNALLLGYAESGEGKVALELFSKMNSRGCSPNSVTYIAAIKACTSLAVNGDEYTKADYLRIGREIHSQIGCHLNSYVQCTLIDMYTKCGSMVDARRVFDSIQKPDVVCWNTVLLGYAESGEGNVVLDMFSRMKAQGCVPDSVTHVACLKACSSLAGAGRHDILQRSREIHSKICCKLDHYLQNTLIDTYAKCGSMFEARRVFEGIQNPDIVSWNALLLGYAESGEGNVALELFSRMTSSGCVPNSVTYMAALKACSSQAVNVDENEKMELLERGRKIHTEIGNHLNLKLINTLVDMYAKCGSMSEARSVFDSVCNHDVVSWNALLLGYAESGEGKVALELFSKMNARNSVTYIAALKACTSLAANADDSTKSKLLEQGKAIHFEVGIHLNHSVQNTLIDMYAKCGCMSEACNVFENMQKPDVVSWNNLLLGYATSGEGSVCLKLLSRMKTSGCSPDSVTYVAAIKACSSLNGNEDRFERGREIHSEIGPHMNKYVQNALIDMYAKCGSMLDAHRVFDTLQKTDVVSWNALLLGYAEAGEEHLVLDLFGKMKQSTCNPTSTTYVAVLKACGSIGALSFGRRVHSEIREFNTRMVTCIVNFYAKCGSMIEAREVFDFHSGTRDVRTWTALLAGYGSLGDSSSVFNLFESMQNEEARPDSITFVCILLCCTHAGLVEKAKEYLDTMPTQYAVTPTLMHYTCMVDALGRANRLNEAMDVIRKMPCNPDAVAWRTLLDACRKWKNVEIGRWAFEALKDLEDKDASDYVLMAHLYGSKGMIEEQKRVLGARVHLGARQTYVTYENG